MRTTTRLVKNLHRRRQRGMTLLEIMIVLAILALVMGLLVGPRVIRMFSKGKQDVASLAVKDLANVAYGQWAAANPSKKCPESIDALAEYANEKQPKDPWGTPYQLLCGPNAPAGVKGVGILSFGEDQKEGTDDDIKSWD